MEEGRVRPGAAATQKLNWLEQFMRPNLGGDVSDEVFRERWFAWEREVVLCLPAIGTTLSPELQIVIVRQRTPCDSAHRLTRRRVSVVRA